ncbi:MAG: hypothetical protein EOM78_19120, partial [Erysipelotrichia bacterium]|nr:hypothetical protein [Erysipelotrichia bacterium]
MKRAIESLEIFKKVEILNEKILQSLARDKSTIVIPREDVTMSLAEEYFSDRQIIFDNIFLRWEKHLVSAPRPINPDIKISHSEFDKKMMS